MFSSAARRVIRVPRIDESQAAAPRAFAVLCPVPAAAMVPGGSYHHHHAGLVPAPATGASVPMVFHMDDDTPLAPEVETDPVSLSARQARETVARLLAPGRTEEALYSSALMAVQASGGDLEGAAQVLARLGYSVQVCTSDGGTLRRLRHSYLSVAPAAGTAGMPAGAGAVVVDPAFAQAFDVTNPTPRFAHILTALPPVLVAPLSRVARAVLVLGEELGRCFQRRGLPLPPWRHTDAVLSKYEAVRSVAVHGSSAAAAAAPGGPHAGLLLTGAAAAAAAAAAATTAAATARRQQQRAQQQFERVQLRLACLGITAALDLPSPPTPTSGGGGSAEESAESPRSVLEAAPSDLTRALHTATKAPKCVCCGWRRSQQQRQPQWRQHQQRRQHHVCVAASAA